MNTVQGRWQSLRSPRTPKDLDLTNPRGELPQDRMRTGLILLLSGAILLLSVLGIGAMRVRSHLLEAEAVGASTGLDLEAREFSAKAYLLLVVAGGLLLMLFLFASYALIRGNRRYMEMVGAKPPKPTDTTDVWSMHRLPDDAPTIISNPDSDEETDPDIRERP